MQLVASVRESLALRLRTGDTIAVRIDGLDKDCSGTISEIVPEAQAASRTFQVKVTGPCPTGIYTGMFGRILINLGQQQVPVIPAAAMRKVVESNWSTSWKTARLAAGQYVSGGRSMRIST